MIIGCSECGTRFVVAPAAIGKDGRRVKCSKCNNIWFQEPAPKDHEIIPDPENIKQEQPPKAGAKGHNKQEEKPGKSEDDALGVFGGDVRKNVPVVVKGRDYKTVIGWAALALFVTGFIGGVSYFRSEIERSSDFAETMYEKWDALVMKDRQQTTNTPTEPVAEVPPHPSTFLSMRQSVEVRLEAEIPSLYIATEITNSSDMDIELPDMTGTIRNAAGLDIFTWSQAINPSIVPANDIMQFEIIVDNIPAETTEAELVFNWPEGQSN